MNTERAVEILEETKELLSLGGSGICGRFRNLVKQDVITFSESDEIKEILFKHKPNRYQYKEFMIEPYWVDSLFWWIPIHKAKETYKIRIDYLEAVINKLKSNT